MIIISQDKTEIINFNNIESIWICSDEEGIFTIEATADTNTSLGKYKTEERAKEVLQEIIKKYVATESFKVTVNRLSDEVGAIGIKNSFIYEMPEE